MTTVAVGCRKRTIEFYSRLEKKVNHLMKWLRKDGEASQS